MNTADLLDYILNELPKEIVFDYDDYDEGVAYLTNTSNGDEYTLKLTKDNSDMNTNKYGVPYHGYHLTLADGRVLEFDMAWEDTWGNVSNWNEMFDGGEDNDYVGYGNEVDGYVEIVKVLDDETGEEIDTWDFLEECEKYVDNYSNS